MAIGGGDSTCSSGVAEPVAETPSPSRQAMAREQAEATRRALERLPEDYRRVLLLRYEEGQSFEEIGRLPGRRRRHPQALAAGRRAVADEGRAPR